jgi:hypothetical protein
MEELYEKVRMKSKDLNEEIRRKRKERESLRI